MRKFDSKVAAFVFILIIVSMFVVSLAVGMSGADVRGNFWEASVGGIIQYAVLLGLFFVVCQLFLRLKGKEIPAAVDLNKRVSFRNLLPVILIFGVMLVSFMMLHQGFADLLMRFGYAECLSADCINEVSKCWACGDGIATWPQYIMAIFVLCLLPAVVEELLFRGLILKGLMPMGKVVAVIASAVLFSLFHLDPLMTIYQFVMGVVFAVVVLRTGNLLYGMIMHFLNNFVIVTMAFASSGDIMELVVWNPVTIIMAVGLAGFGALMLVGLVRALKPHEKHINIPKTQRFWSRGNIGFFIGVAFAASLWVITLLMQFGVG